MKYTFRFKDKSMTLGEDPRMMGIVNVTPDSFYDGGRHDAVGAAVEYALKLIGEGADIIDVGGESTRPGHEPVDEETECSRVVPVIRELRRQTDIPISVDTMKTRVAEAALDAGADILNDVTGLHLEMTEKHALLRQYGAGCVVMHWQERPAGCGDTSYVDWVVRYLDETVNAAVVATGLDRDHFMVDPGIGFSKSDDENLRLLAHIDRLHDTRTPVLLGISRKSFIGRLAKIESPDDRLFGTAGVTAVGAWLGVEVHRVHDVAAMRQAAQMAMAIARYT
ncbi:MAG: dihydropteroate synthase [Victivallales bacterium]|nr:dihydropteroate synthase [Victivallales bacterium]